MKKYFLFSLMSLVSVCAVAQLSQISPQKPMQADLVTMSYDSNLPEAKLKTTEPIYVRITATLQDGGITKFHQPLKNLSGKLSTNIKLPPSTASFKAEFYTLNKDDDAAIQNVMIYDHNRLKPVKSAYFDSFFSSKFDSLYQLEIGNHPDNYLAVAKYINMVSMMKDPEAGKTQIKDLLRDLASDSIKNTQNKVGLLTALCVGNAKISELILSKKSLFQLFAEYPNAAETAFAFSTYTYEYYKASGKWIEDDVKEKLKTIFIGYPNAAICRYINTFEFLHQNKEIPTIAFEKVIKPQYVNDELSYYELGHLPELYIERNENLESARSLLLASIKRFQNGDIQHQYRLSSSHYQTYVPLLLFDLGKIDQLQGNLQSAIINTSAAIQLLTGSSVEGNFLPMMLDFRASSYKKMGNFNLALDDFKRNYLTGNVAALDSMRSIFPFCTVKQQTFALYLSALKPKTEKQTVKLDLLSNFTGIDLKGNKVNLADLKGKVVVINVWSTGCGPCIAEMPVLNELVEQYAARPDVVFIAVSGEGKEDLIKFFRSRKFDYKVWSGVQDIVGIFNTNTLPVHMVLGKNGEIINRSVGGRADIKQYLKGIIDTNL